MAIRRMLSKKIIDTDAFMDMPLSTQALYMHLVINADDDGFVGSPKKVMRSIGCMNDDIKILLGKKFILDFDSGVIVIKHWKIHNLIRIDRYTKTTYQKEFSLLEEKKNKSYTLTKPTNTNVIPSGNQMAPQVSLGKVSLGKVSLEEHIVVETTPIPKEKSFKEYDSKYIFNLNEIKKMKFFSDIEVNDLFIMLLIQRTKLKKPAINSKTAIITIYNKLKKLGNTDCIMLLSNAIESSWKTVYPKENKQTPKPEERKFTN